MRPLFILIAILFTCNFSFSQKLKFYDVKISFSDKSIKKGFLYDINSDSVVIILKTKGINKRNVNLYEPQLFGIKLDSTIDWVLLKRYKIRKNASRIG